MEEKKSFLNKQQTIILVLVCISLLILSTVFFIEMLDQNEKSYTVDARIKSNEHGSDDLIIEVKNKGDSKLKLIEIEIIETIRNSTEKNHYKVYIDNRTDIPKTIEPDESKVIIETKLYNTSLGKRESDHRFDKAGVVTTKYKIYTDRGVCEDSIQYLYYPIPSFD